MNTAVQLALLKTIRKATTLSLRVHSHWEKEKAESFKNIVIFCRWIFRVNLPSIGYKRHIQDQIAFAFAFGRSDWSLSVNVAFIFSDMLRFRRLVWWHSCFRSDLFLFFVHLRILIINGYGACLFSPLLPLVVAADRYYSSGAVTTNSLSSSTHSLLTLTRSSK